MPRTSDKSHMSTPDPTVVTADVCTRLSEFLDQEYGLRSRVAEALGISNSVVGHWPKRGSISFGNALGLHRKFGLSLDWLAAGVGRMHVAPDLASVFPDADTPALREALIDLATGTPGVRVFRTLTYDGNSKTPTEECRIEAEPDTLRLLQSAWGSIKRHIKGN